MMADNALVDTDRLALNYAAVLRRRQRALRVATRYGLPTDAEYIRLNSWQLIALGEGRQNLEGYIVCERHGAVLRR
jgi:hypothetical protein